MKKSLKTLLAFVLICVAIPPIQKANALESMYTSGSYIKVGLNNSSNENYQKVSVYANGVEIFDETGKSLYKTKNNNAVTLTTAIDALGFSIKSGTSTVASAVKLKYLRIHPLSGTIACSSSSLTKTSYNGDICLYRYTSGTDGGKVYAINLVTLKDYTRGVVGAEIGSSYVEAIKAQAVCAASYAKHHSRHTAGFTICNTTHCQVYRGTLYDNTTNIVTAVNAVGGKVMRYTGSGDYNGKIVEALYFSNTGATQTIDSVDYGGKSIPYLKSVNSSVEDKSLINSNYFDWTFTMDQTFAKTYYGIGEIVDIKTTTKNGSVNKIVLTSASGQTKTYTNDKCRSFANSSSDSEQKIKSPHFTVTKVAASSGATALTKGSAKNSIGSTVYSLSKDGKTSKSINDLYIIDKNNKVAKAPTTSYNFVIKGKGWGHFVGMSQIGAISMAKAGKSYLDILKKYYGSNIEVK